jgi:hypothetical protein
MPREVPAEAGFFRVELRALLPRELCEGWRDDFVARTGDMVDDGFGQVLQDMPSVAVEPAMGEASAQLVLEWTGLPATSPWHAVEMIIELVKTISPDLLVAPDRLGVTVTTERRIGHDVILDDDQLAELEQEVRRRADWSS